MALHISKRMCASGRSSASPVLPRRTIKCQAAAAATSSGCSVQLKSAGRSDMNVSGGDLAAYVRDSPTFFSSVDMPMGGSLRSVDLDEGVFELTVPRIQMFDLWIQPRAVAHIRVQELPNGNAGLAVHATECKLLGSHHVEQFKLNERFSLDVSFTFQSDQPKGPGTPGSIRARGNIGVNVDIPPPFSLMPKGVLETTGNTALNSTVSILLNAFITAMAKDYVRWNQQRKALQQAARTGSAV